MRIDDGIFVHEAHASELPLLVEFGARWCGPCKVLLPMLERLAAENVGRVRVAEADIDESPGLARRFGIRGAPTVVVFRAGTEVARQLGVTSRARLLEMLKL
jgi:thioredoxin 1